ncbi:hypothetical protein PVAG01_01285 [Phlyctema vagabunda]|uniref:Uncharacterized protein n=1 Tax=Phlyctema vagabunda TaxID=108571 RepID=A0ABR4PY42_9HELO
MVSTSRYLLLSQLNISYQNNFMRSSILQLSSSLRTCTNTYKPSISSSRPLRAMSTGVPSSTAGLQKQADQKTPSMSDLEIENTNINTSTGVSLSEQQKVYVGSILDLFAGRPSLKKLQLWADDAQFNDPITHATGRKQYEPQWYGLVAAFSEIERLSHNVTSAGNPISMDMKTRYKIKGVGTEKIIESAIKIHYDETTGKITNVEDKWNNELPDGAFAKAFRNANSVVVPAFVSVPKNEEEDRKKGL